MRLFEILKAVDCNKSRFRISAPPPYGYTEKSALGRTDLSAEVKPRSSAFMTRQNGPVRVALRLRGNLLCLLGRLSFQVWPLAISTASNPRPRAARQMLSSNTSSGISGVSGLSDSIGELGEPIWRVKKMGHLHSGLYSYACWTCPAVLQ